MKRRDLSLDVIRIIAIFMIIVFHFAGTWGYSDTHFLFFANGTWGSLGTAIFFALSGFLLRKKYINIGSVKKYYFKRWLSLFPAFYIAFIVAYLINVIRLGSFFYQEPGYSLIYSFLGIDNYLNWFGISTYAIVGEWFTAVIVILYFLFPLLNRIMSNYKITATVIFTLFYIIYNYYELYPKLPEISIVTCAFVFWIGMLMAEREEKIKITYAYGIIVAIASLILLVVKVNMPEIFCVDILAFSIIVTVIVFFKDVRPGKKVSHILTYLSEVSYAVYLVHHYIVNNLKGLEMRFSIIGQTPTFAVFTLYMLIVMISAAILKLVTEKLIKLFINISK